MQTESKNVKFAVIADPHYYSEKLGITGRAYELRNESDQKLLAESGAVLRAALEELTESDVSFIIIAGDVSNDGEAVSHEEFREILRSYGSKKPFYLITATHDWCCDGNPRRYDGDNVFNDVPVLKPEELRDYYSEFGPDSAISEFLTDEGATSYCLRPAEGITFLCLNDDRNGEGGSGYAENHLEWIRSECKKAQERGDTVYATEHHHLLLTPLDRLISGSGSVRYKEEMTGKLADAGIKIIFTGHSHMQHITKLTSPNGNSIYEINVAAISGYPSPIAYCTAYSNALDIDVSHLKGFTYKGEHYTAEYIKNHALNLFVKVVNAAVDNRPDEFVALVAAIGMSKENALKKWKLARFGLKKLNKATVRSTARLINTFTFGRGINSRAAKGCGDVRVLDIVLDLFLSILDGGINKHTEDEPYYTVVKDAVSLPLRAVNALHIKNNGLKRTLTYLANTGVQALRGGDIDANHAHLTY